ncbi:MAG: hypothetical protein K0Q79_1982 [Flavipsychrobacter sp.]|nr:hypothetical protein [Flavipsychrobacter sp.]
MKKNVGKLDRGIRIMAAAIIVVLYFTGVLTGVLAVGLFVLAAVFILTGSLEVCPLYMPFGISTRPKENKNENKTA